MGWQQRLDCSFINTMTSNQARKFIRSHLQRRGNKPVIVTERMCQYWWRVLNSAIFYSKLHPLSSINVARTRGAFAWTIGLYGSDGRVSLKIQQTFPSRLMFLTVLVHEMVHAWEYQHCSTMGHGKRFFLWQGRIKRTVGMDLQESLNEEDYTYD